jgi:hypothetical protein
MAKEKTNTQKIMEAVANIPELSKIWAEAIKDQNDTSVWGAWNAMVKYFYPTYSNLKPFEILDILDAENPSPEIKSASIQPLKCISEILNTLDETTSLGEEINVLTYNCLCPEGAWNTAQYFIYLTYTLDGYYYRMDEEGYAEKQSWFSSNLLSENELLKICRETEQESIREYATWVLAFCLQEAGSEKDFLYKLYVTEDRNFYYVEEPDGTEGEFQASPIEAFENSSLKFDINKPLKVTEADWDKETITYKMSWEDFNIKWQSQEEEQAEE